MITGTFDVFVDVRMDTRARLIDANLKRNGCQHVVTVIVTRRNTYEFIAARSSVLDQTVHFGTTRRSKRQQRKRDVVNMTNIINIYY